MEGELRLETAGIVGSFARRKRSGKGDYTIIFCFLFDMM
jgi:hypothetical protein